MSTKLRTLTPMLLTLDMKRTIGWYVSVLGFTCVAKQGDDWCLLERDSVALMFMRDRSADQPMATGTQYIYVDDLHDLWQRLKDQITPEWGPEVTPYGMFEFAVRDPNGYLLSFGQEVPEAAPYQRQDEPMLSAS